MIKRVLITGANGFLAKYLSRELALQYHVTGLVKRRGENLSFNQIYIRVEDLVLAEPYFDYIFHLASFIPEPGNIDPDVQYEQDNIVLTHKLVTAYPLARFVFSSSVSVYGSPLNLPIQINSPFNNPGLYGKSKLAAEEAVKTHNNYCIIRFTSLIGLGMKPTTFIPRIIEQAKHNKEIILLGDGSRKQDYLDVRDAVRLCYLSAVMELNSIILGVSGKSYSNQEVAKLVQTIIPCSIRFSSTDTSPSFLYDAEESQVLTGFVPKYPLIQTLSDIAQA